MNKIQIIKYIGIIAYFAIAIGVQATYHNPLFNHTFDVEEDWQKDASSSLIKFFKGMSALGAEFIFLPLLIIVFFFFPLNKSYTFFSVLVMSTYLDNLLKIIYSNPRPFWIKTVLFQSCETGYGNPSGHAFSSTAVYLSLWHCVTDFDTFKKTTKGIAARIGLLIFFLLLIITIIISRMFLGVHSIDQVIYGASLGLGTYLCYFIVFDVFQTKDFSEYICNKISIIIHAIVFGLFFIAGLVCYLSIDKDIEQYNALIMTLCPDTKIYKKFKDEGFYAVLIIFFIIGLHFGYLILFKYMEHNYPNKKDVIVNWNRNGEVKHFILRILLFIPFLIVMILYAVVPATNEDLLGLAYTFKFAFPYLVTGLLISSAYFITCIKVQLIILDNKDNAENAVEKSNNVLKSLSKNEEGIEAQNKKEINDNVILDIKK